MAAGGLIQVYTGDGKGKTTAALGLALRAWGQGWRVAVVQFMKDDPGYGEVKASRRMPGLEIFPVGRNDFVDLSQPAQLDKELARQGWALARKLLDGGEYQLVILDELNVALACGLLPVDEVADFLRAYRARGGARAEVVLTGRYAPQAVLELADLITEMKALRHPFDSGVDAREGIEH